MPLFGSSNKSASLDEKHRIHCGHSQAFKEASWAGDKMEKPCVSEYVALLTQLRSLIAQGKGNSAEADTLRNRMDESWGCLTAEDVANIDKRII